ncbi:MAG: DUF721 domain-containing protein [Candidatus Fermentibacteria bacterium]|nr:DUF721 domain-containing protein [Candidatus Fermentibacteria bacterium]
MKSVRSLVENLWLDLELSEFSSRKRALQFWKTAAGGKISSMCSLEGFSDSTVIVRAMNPAVAMELRYRSSEIVEALNKAAGKELFCSLKIVLRPTC